jgi:asparagine synthetase B (glutamine-hydrolysing)
VSAPERPIPRPAGRELLVNLLLGLDPAAPELPPAKGDGVRAALERAVLPALRRPPCLISFSGGRDSSAMLAVAADAARRHGLSDPVPAIMRFPGAPGTDETSWQELAMGHLGIREPELIELREELDALGPIATAVIGATGVMWPANAYMHVPILDRGRGGSLVTGAGGDELLGTIAARHVLLARRRARPRARDALSVPLAAVPRPLRAAVWRRRNAPPQPGLTRRGAARASRALAREEVSWPHRWDRSVAHWYRSRAYAALDHALAPMAAPRDVLVVNPFLDPGVLAELRAAGGATGFPGRTGAMRALFGDLLPEELIARRGKAAFNDAVWGPAVRDFASGWGGEGVDERDVDVAELRRHWLSARPDFGTALLLHAAWLASRAPT